LTLVSFDLSLFMLLRQSGGFEPCLGHLQEDSPLAIAARGFRPP
jgi:hypothetical protein